MTDEPAPDWVWASALPDLPSSRNVLRALREMMHDDTPVSRQANLPFFPLDVLKLVAEHVDYGYKVRPVSALPVSALPVLLYHPQYPAKLVKHTSTIGSTPRSIFYLHLWHEGHATYVRGFYTLFQARHTPKGIHHNVDWNQYSIAVDVDKEDERILGQKNDVAGVLVDWFATEVAKDPVHYLGSSFACLLRGDYETRKELILFHIQPHRRLIQPDRTCLVKIKFHCDLRIPILDVLQAGVSKPLYAVPKQDKKEHEDVVAYQARVDALNLPSPCNLVPPHSINDVSWLLLGWIMRDACIGYMTHVMQVSQAQPEALDVEDSTE
jgi:hypothetical protein